MNGEKRTELAISRGVSTYGRAVHSAKGTLLRVKVR